MGDERPLRVFLSSTSGDLDAHREAVIAQFDRRGWTPVAMESFGADPRESLRLCREKIATCDAIVVLVAHRYGTLVEGKSYTWWEVEEAERLGLNVWGYVVPDGEPWSGPKESDRLAQVLDDPDAIAEVAERVRLLNELKTRLRKRSTGKITQDVAALAGDVVADLSRSAPRGDAAEPAMRWKPRFAHALQPASRFGGRERILSELAEWLADPGSPDRVVALVAIGGTGKTAVVERVLREVDPHAQRDAGLFVWSFYEGHQTEKFLAEAGAYFAGKAVSQEDRGGALQRLKAALRSGPAHTLVLDGLERVQAEGHGSRARGEIEDQGLRQLLRLLVGGHLGRSRALITTRFAVRDLMDWSGRGLRSVTLTDLVPAAARGVLRAWGVHGDDAVLDALAGRVGRHALSVCVLGSFVGRLGGGDPSVVDELDLSEDAGDSPESRRLGKLLAHYQERLAPDERQVMGWLSAFPRGLSMELLGFLTRADGEVAGVLVGCGQVRLTRVLERLRGLGLVFRDARGGELRYSAHPFLRDHFGGLLGVEPAGVHDVVRAELAGSLEARPGSHPTDPAVLDRYETLIEHTLEAGQVLEAFDLYWYALGAYAHLGKNGVGDYLRGRRILDRFRDGPSLTDVAPELSGLDRGALLNDLGLYSKALGDLESSRRLQAAAGSVIRAEGDPENESVIWRSACSAELVAGKLLQARVAAETALDRAQAADHEDFVMASLAYIAAVDVLRGDLAKSTKGFAEARALMGGRDLVSSLGLQHARLLVAMGDDHGARRVTQANLEVCELNSWGRDIAGCHEVLARTCLPDDPARGQAHLEQLRAWADRSGEVEMVLLAHEVAALIALAENDPTTARDESEEGIAVADTHGFGIAAISLRLAASQAAFALADTGRSLQLAREALDLATDPECGYAWGEADAAHLCGVAHASLGDFDLARRRFTQALQRRIAIEHPSAADTRARLEALPPPSAR